MIVRMHAYAETLFDFIYIGGNMNNKNEEIRPLFRILYGTVSAFCVWGIYLGFVTISRMLDDKVLRIGGLLMWFIIIFQLFLMWFAYITFIIAISGKPPKYISRVLNKYRGHNT